MKDNLSSLMDIILANTDILNSVDSYNSGFAIWEDVIIPADFTGAKSINIYQNTPAKYTMGHDETISYASCRANTYLDSKAIALNLIDKLNRYSMPNKGIKMKLLPTIGPKDPTDNFNTPVEIYYISKL